MVEETCWKEKVGRVVLLSLSRRREVSSARARSAEVLVRDWVHPSQSAHGGYDDLRRHAATHASRSGVPVEIVSKVILRHTNLSTTQRYLGKVTDTEAIRWIDNLYS